ncbi:DUF1810 family protein [Vulcanococcus limneticus Candia 3F8]|uniref:DUF1810 family protein n=1 Tax=Vulcanococcus limneticus TaxID=2170428 RepID=UPI0018E3E917|nr:DUF1810 family protein [Vulcanococcus limneticus]MCP9793368.1 DUF1810 family protein [Vulcanococcus limneticus MW73D5]MCP9895376.1 DUF1810 family protein [Vulcanococcus limneticus Candia 3F8]
MGIFGLHRFPSAQDHGQPSACERAMAELNAGGKTSHWIWFVLPQLAGLGQSAMARSYSIAGLAEAQAYLADPVLRMRLEAVISVIVEQLQRPGQSLPALMGSDLDAAKTISSLTLFEAAGLPQATALVDQLGQRCPRTRHMLGLPVR